MTPLERYVLPGVSRQKVIELAGATGIEVVEQDLDLFDAYTADEAFVSSTSLCLCPIESFNGKPLAERKIPGPVTRTLMDVWIEELGFDFVAQYLSYL